jgi:hypothetical protein
MLKNLNLKLMKFIILVRILFFVKYKLFSVNFYRKSTSYYYYMLKYVCVCVCEFEWREKECEEKLYATVLTFLFSFVNCLYRMTTKWYMYRCHIQTICLCYLTRHIKFFVHFFFSFSLFLIFIPLHAAFWCLYLCVIKSV